MSVTVPYDPQFYTKKNNRNKYYNGASLAAFVRLGKEKGYRLVGVERYGFNAFFLRNDVAQEIFPEVQPEDCFSHPMNKWMMEVNLPKVKDYDWEEV